MSFGLDCITRSSHVSLQQLLCQGQVNDWDRLEAFMEHTMLTYIESHQLTPIQRMLLTYSFNNNLKTRCRLA